MFNSDLYAKIEKVVKELGTVKFIAPDLYEQVIEVEGLEYVTLKQVQGAIQNMGRKKKIYRTYEAADDGSKYIVWSTILPRDGIKPKKGFKKSKKKNKRPKSLSTPSNLSGLVNQIKNLESLSRRHELAMHHIRKAQLSMDKALSLLGG